MSGFDDMVEDDERVITSKTFHVSATFGGPLFDLLERWYRRTDREGNYDPVFFQIQPLLLHCPPLMTMFMIMIGWNFGARLTNLVPRIIAQNVCRPSLLLDV